MSLVTVNDLQEYMRDIDLTSSQQDAAELIISGVQGELERYCNRPLEPCEYTEIVRSDATGYAYLLNTPVVSITSITMSGALAATPISVFEQVQGGFFLGAPNYYATVVYTAGKNLFVGSELNAVRLAILRVAAREMQTNHDDTLSIKDGLEREPAPPQPRGWQRDELLQFDRFRRRVAI